MSQKTKQHPMLTFWDFGSYGGVGTSWVDQKYLSSGRCPACGAHLSEKSCEYATLSIAGRGSKWPDILTCNIPIFSERVVRTITQAGLTGFIAHYAKIVEVDIKKLAEPPYPKYFLMEITGRVDIDLDQMRNTGGDVCPECFSLTKTPNQSDQMRVVPKLETWDGSDFVRTRNWNTGLYYCTRAFVDLACKNRWTNLVFGSSVIPRIGMWGAKPPEGAISYFDPDWFKKTEERVKAKYPDLFK